MIQMSNADAIYPVLPHLNNLYLFGQRLQIRLALVCIFDYNDNKKFKIYILYSILIVEIYSNFKHEQTEHIVACA
jgi:hypothetical protein